MSDSEVLIVGAGVSGLATHLALSARGIASRIFERAPEPRLHGGPLWLWSNAIAVLDRLGLGQQVRRQGVVLEHNEVRTWEGDTLFTIPVGDMSALHGAPSVVIERPKLLEILLGAIDQRALECGFESTTIEQKGERVWISSAAGARACGSLLIGADGLRSKVREYVVGDGEPRAAGQTAWVGMGRLSHPLLTPGIAIATLGVKKRVWTVSLGADKTGWYAILDEDEKEPRAALSDAHSPIPELFSKSNVDDIVVTRLFDRPPVRGWSRGRVVLIGDAVHPATPDIGQGACQGLESALCLARALAEDSMGERALLRYESDRAVRTAHVARLAKMTSWVMGRKDPLFAELRNRSIALNLPWAVPQVFDYILRG